MSIPTAKPEPRPASTISPRVSLALQAIVQAYPGAQIDTRDPLGIWTEALSELSDGQVREAIRALSYRQDRFPPAPGEFRQMGLASKIAAHQPLPRGQRIGAVRAADDVASDAMAKLRAMVGPRRG